MRFRQCWLINPLCARVMFERSTYRGLQNRSGTFSDGWGGSLEQVAEAWVTRRQEQIFVNYQDLFIETQWFKNNTHTHTHTHIYIHIDRCGK